MLPVTYASLADSRYLAPKSMGCAELLLPLLVDAVVRCGQLGVDLEPVGG